MGDTCLASTCEFIEKRTIIKLPSAPPVLQYMCSQHTILPLEFFEPAALTSSALSGRSHGTLSSYPTVQAGVVPA